jgi:hypothetical protein
MYLLQLLGKRLSEVLDHLRVQRVRVLLHAERRQHVHVWVRTHDLLITTKFVCIAVQLLVILVGIVTVRRVIRVVIIVLLCVVIVVVVVMRMVVVMMVIAHVHMHRR